MSDLKYCPKQAQRTRRNIVKMGAIAAPVLLANLGGNRPVAAYDAENGASGDTTSSLSALVFQDWRPPRLFRRRDVER